MKPTSIIFLVVSVLLVLGGFAAVGVARQMAVTEGIELVSSVADDAGNYIYYYDYDADSIGKITIDIKDADVNIIGGAAKPYVELINFPEGMYELSSTNRNLNIGNNIDFTSLNGIASLAMNFRGLRSLINYYNIHELEKTVNVYLCDEHPVNIIDCRVETGTVTVKNNATETDYNVEIGTGSLDVSEIVTTSVLNVSIETGDVKIDDSVISYIDGKIGTGSMDFEGELRNIEMTIETGDFNYRSTYGQQYYNLVLSTNVGSITVDGEDFGGAYERMSFPTSDLITIDIGTGSIDIENAESADASA